LDGAGELTRIGTTDLATGNVPHHVDVDPQGQWVYVSNHDSNFVSGYRIGQDGSLSPMTADPGSPVTGPTEPAENQPHSSVIDQTRQFLYVVAGHNGPSTIRAYRIDQTTGIPTFIAGQSFPAGSHAHNMAISPNNQYIYVASELSNDLHAYSRNTSTGELTVLPIVTGLNGPQAVTVDPQSRFVYVTHRNEVVVFQIGSDGSLTRIQGVSAFPTGNEPHAIAMHPNGQTLYTANLNASTISVFRVDSTTGALTDIQSPAPATGTDPNFVVVHPNGKFLFTADNVADTVSRFPINDDGTLGAPLTPVQSVNGANGIGTTKL
jgi:6-phosphogluconolactonase (cycloisomerase 2 family)